MNKSQQVAEFIRINNPKRKDIIKHLVCNISKKMTEEQFDALEGRAKKNINAHWSTNFAKWRWVGTIKVTAGRYALTPLYRGSLYTTKLTPIKPIESNDTYWQEQYAELSKKFDELHADYLIKSDKLADILDIVE